MKKFSVIARASNFRNYLKLLFFAFYASNAFAGEFYERSDNLSRCTAVYFFSGSIVSGDAKKIANIMDRQVKANESNPMCKFLTGALISLNIDSEGGDVTEALNFGRILRKYEISASVAFNKKCLSACVYLLAGAVDRQIAGRVGIHRSYFSDLSTSDGSSQIKQKIDALEVRVIDYLKEMNVSTALYYDSQSVVPEKMKILSDSDLERYRLDGEDVVYNEKKIKQQADLYGLSMVEYRKREALGLNACRKSNQNSDSMCFQRHLLGGISIEEMKRRVYKLQANCQNADNFKDFNVCYKRYVVNGG